MFPVVCNSATIRSSRCYIHVPTSGCLTMPKLSESQVKCALRLVSMPRPMPSMITRSVPSAATFTSCETCQINDQAVGLGP